MFQGLIAAFKNKDLRQKILFTVMVILIFRIGIVIPVPFIDTSVVGNWFASTGENLMGMLNLMSGGGLEQASLFALGISPYINASIIVQLLTIAIPALERLKNQEDGQKTINKITRYVTAGLSLVMGYGYYTIIVNQMSEALPLSYKGFFPAVVIVAAFVAGSALVMWLAEKIDEYGIGNGISMILFAGIMAQGRSFVTSAINDFSAGRYVGPIVLAVICLLMLVGIVWVNNAERRIPVQYAKRVVGRKMYGGNQTHLPMKVLMTGVMPIIFASSFCMLPSTIASFVPGTPFAEWVSKWFTANTWPYSVVFFILIIAFNYFYVSVSYDPVEISNNLQKNGGSIPGIRPGEPTVNYIKKSLNKITLLGAIFLGIIAIVPMIASSAVTAASGVQQNYGLSGNSLLIAVSIILETSMLLESQVSMRHYKGFLE